MLPKHRSHLLPQSWCAENSYVAIEFGWPVAISLCGCMVYYFISSNWGKLMINLSFSARFHLNNFVNIVLNLKTFNSLESSFQFCFINRTNYFTVVFVHWKFKNFTCLNYFQLLYLQFKGLCLSDAYYKIWLSIAKPY